MLYCRVICVVLFIMLYFSPAFHAHADTVHLKNGDVITGQIVACTDTICTFDSRYASGIVFTIAEIKALTTDNSYDVLFTTGERIKGRFLITDAQKTVIQADNFGQFEVKPSLISGMVRIFPESAPQKPAQQAESAVSKRGESTVPAPAGTDKEVAEAEQSYGEKQEEAPPLDFLTGSTVLLAPGTVELELDLNYRNSRNEYRLMNVGQFERSAFSARSFEMGLSARAGLWDGFEASVRVPFTYSRVHDVSTNAFVRQEESWDVGDINLGLQYLLAKETAAFPAVSVSLGVNLPTGEKHYRDVTTTWKDPLDSGSGHWALSPGISFVRTTDPAIIYGGIAGNYAFKREIDGYDIQPGWGVRGFLGVGFALNEKLSLGGRVSYGYNSELEADGVTVKGSDHEPMDVSFSLSYRAWDNFVITPQVTYGLNDDSGAPMLGIRFTRRF